MSTTPPTPVDTGIGTEVDDTSQNPVFLEFLRREKEAQDATTDSTQVRPTLPAPGEAPPEPTDTEPPTPGDKPDDSPASQQEPASTEGESPLAPDSPSVGQTPPSAEPEVEGHPTQESPAQVTGDPAGEVEGGEGGVGDATPLGEPAPLLTYGGVPYAEEDVSRMVSTDNWVRGIKAQYDIQTPQGVYNPAIHAIDSLLQGQYKLVPAADNIPPFPGPFGHPSSSAATAQQVSPPSGSPPEASEEDDLLDPALKARFDRIESSVSQITDVFQQQAQAQVQAQQTQVIQALDTGRQSFQAEHNLSDAEVSQLVDRVVGYQVLPTYIQRHQGNYTAAMRQALEDHFWADPTFRQKAMSQAATDASTTETTQTRTRKVSAITGAGGSTAPRTEPPANTKDTRRQGMVSAIARHINGDQPN